jgi:hypothetical protein
MPKWYGLQGLIINNARHELSSHTYTLAVAACIEAQVLLHDWKQSFQGTCPALLAGAQPTLQLCLKHIPMFRL